MQIISTTQSFNSRCYLFSIYFALQTKSKLFTHFSIVLCLKSPNEYAVIFKQHSKTKQRSWADWNAPIRMLMRSDR